jgi:RNA polymerase I-specific transcription initiation factor RRN6
MTTPTTATAAIPIPTSFPVLVPSYTFSFRIGGPTSPVGAFTRGQPLTVVSIVRGSVRTEANREGAEEVVRLEATVRGNGVDYVRNDPDGGRMRLDAGVVVE